LVALVVTIGSLQRINAQTFYKVHHINETFDNLGGSVLPTGWATTASTAALFARSGGTNTDNSMLRQSAGGSGNRGMDISFPSPAIADSVSNIWFVEFDWKCEKVVLGPKNAFGLVFSGSTNNKNLRAANWYVASIFGLYLNGDGYFHYWNQDLKGPYQSDSATRSTTSYYYNHMGPVFRGGSDDGKFSRNGVAATFAKATVNTTLMNDSVNAWNAPTKTNVKFVYDSISKIAVATYGPRYLASKTYHILAKLNFATQKVESLTITQKDSTANSQTISDMPFMAPTMHGNDTTVVARADRMVKDLKFISQFNTRTSTAGSGPNVDYSTFVDNMEIYYLKESVGTSDVTVNYKDKDGNIAKTARVATAQQNNEIFRLLDTDKEAFIENGFYYAYDAVATKEANIDNSVDGESIVISPTNNTLTVVFKKFTAVAGPLTWTGFEGPFVNQTDGNFKFGETINLAYQNGKGIDFSDATAPKDVIVDGTINLGTADVTLNTTGYTISGNGKTTDKFTGTGKFIVNAPATLNMINTMDVQVNILDGVTIKNPNCADSIFAVNNALLKLEPSATINKKIVGAGKGSVLNIELVTSTKGIEYNFGVANTSTINFKLKNAGKVDGSSWTSRMSATYPDSAQINVTNEIVGKDTIAGFSAIAGSIGKVKIHLGDSVRLVRNYNETDKETVTIGEITGTEKSIIEAGFVSGRSQTYAVGNLNTDAVFNGTIRQLLMSNKTFRTGSTLHLNKIGTGKWTLNGPLKFIGDIEVKAGTLELNATVDTTVTTLTVDSLASLKSGRIYIGTKNAVVKKFATLNSQSTSFRGDLQVSGTLQGATTAYNVGVIDGTINLNINSFNEGEFEILTSESDITMIRSTINLHIAKAQAGSIIKIMNAGSGSIAFPEGPVGSVVKVNGEDITANTEETPGAKFVYFAETGELKCLADFTGVKNVNANKEIKSVEFFNVLGNQIDKYSKGLIIRKITYTDNSTGVEKIFLPK
jgi:autotransporter-associated beta strand protein